MPQLYIKSGKRKIKKLRNNLVSIRYFSVNVTHKFDILTSSIKVSTVHMGNILIPYITLRFKDFTVYILLQNYELIAFD